MPIDITVNIVESTNKIAFDIVKAIVKDLNKKMIPIIPQIEDVVRQKIFQGITSQPEYTAIQSGDLKIELGLINGANRLRTIIDVWALRLRTRFRPFRAFKNKITGGLRVEAIRSDYADVLKLAESILVTEKGESLPWLRWLLFEGNNTIILDYSVRFQTGAGRTGGGIMVKGGSWGIPYEFAGGINDNFVTRGINSVGKDLQNDIINTIERNI